MTTRTHFERLFDPHSIAVIGASTNPSKRGYQAVRALQVSGYPFPVHPVNPTATEILGLPVASAITDPPPGIDVALLAVPAAAVPDALRECAKVGIAGAVVLANGFKEIGERGAQLEGRLVEAVAETGIRVIGPNTSGMLNATTGANLVGLHGVPKGPISVITQSGNMLLSLVTDNDALRGPGFHTCIGLGNQADVRYDECVTELVRQDHTGAVAIHSEGLPGGRAFLVASVTATAEKPVVMLRGGRSEIGQRTALSHTGSIAGSDAVAATAVLGQCGIELVDRCDELAVVAGALATTRSIHPGHKVAILSDRGGHATLAADALATAGIELAELVDSTRAALRAVLGRAAVVHNPVDVAGATDADPTLFAEAAEALMGDPHVGLVLVVGVYGGYHLRFDERRRAQEDATASRLLDLIERRQVPLVVQSCYAHMNVENHDLLRTGGVPVLSSIDHVVRVVAALDRRGHRLATLAARSDLTLPWPLSLSAGHPAGAMDEPSARRLVESFGIDTGTWTVATDAEAVLAAVQALHQSCAIKIVSPQVIHTSDVGGVTLNVTATDAVVRAQAMIDNVLDHVPDATITGIVVSPMAPGGLRAARRGHPDPIFGPVVAFGTGGVTVGALRDVSFRAAPLTELEATEMMGETLASRLLDGYRHLPAVDRSALARFLVQVGDLVAAHPQISELDLNPVIATHDAILPVDVRIVLSDNN